VSQINLAKRLRGCKVVDDMKIYGLRFFKPPRNGENKIHFERVTFKWPPRISVYAIVFGRVLTVKWCIKFSK
jgi:hypothetical protein